MRQELKELCDRRKWPQPEYKYIEVSAAAMMAAAKMTGPLGGGGPPGADGSSIAGGMGGFVATAELPQSGGLNRSPLWK